MQVKLKNKDFLAIIEAVHKVFLELPFIVDSDGINVRNISDDKALVVGLHINKDDVDEFFFSGNEMKFAVPFGEFLDSIKKIKAPITLMEDNGKFIIKNDRISFVIDEYDFPSASYDDYKLATSKHTKDNKTNVIVSASDFISAVDLLSFTSSGIKVSISEGKMRFASTKGALNATYEVDVEHPDGFVWSAAFSSLYMKVIAKVAAYADKVTLYLGNPTDTGVEPSLVFMNLGTASNIFFIMGEQISAAPVVAHVDEESEEEEFDTLELESDDVDEDFF